eukprot:6202846-Pleurochrysis_carterae.AAC.2
MVTSPSLPGTYPIHPNDSPGSRMAANSVEKLCAGWPPGASLYKGAMRRGASTWQPAGRKSSVGSLASPVRSKTTASWSLHSPLVATTLRKEGERESGGEGERGAKACCGGCACCGWVCMCVFASGRRLACMARARLRGGRTC